MSYYADLPSRGMRDQQMFTCRMWCIYFWEVEIHCPERVLRQFGLFQTVPPPAPVDFEYLEDLRSWNRGNGLLNDGFSVDWRDQFENYIEAEHVAVGEQRPYDRDRYD